MIRFLQLLVGLVSKTDGQEIILGIKNKFLTGFSLTVFFINKKAGVVVKNLIFSFAITLLFLVGCTSTYKLSDYPNKEKFYEDFNDFAGNKDIRISLINDSSFTSNGMAQILKDTLTITRQTLVGDEKLKLNEIEKINYYGTNFSTPSAMILLKSGTELNCENVKVLSDSLVQITKLKNIYESIPLSRIKEISFKNRWLGIIIDFPAGIFTGTVIGSIYTSISSHSSFLGTPVIVGAAVGLVAGVVVGSLAGYNYTYVFNP